MPGVGQPTRGDGAFKAQHWCGGSGATPERAVAKLGADSSFATCSSENSVSPDYKGQCSQVWEIVQRKQQCTAASCGPLPKIGVERDGEGVTVHSRAVG